MTKYGVLTQYVCKKCRIELEAGRVTPAAELTKLAAHDECEHDWYQYPNDASSLNPFEDNDYNQLRAKKVAEEKEIFKQGHPDLDETELQLAYGNQKLAEDHFIPGPNMPYKVRI